MNIIIKKENGMVKLLNTKEKNPIVLSLINGILKKEF